MDIEARLRELGIELPAASNPAASYANCARSGDLLFVSGKGPLPTGGAVPKGKLGREYTTEQGQAFARSDGRGVRRARSPRDVGAVMGAISLRAGLPIVIESIFEVES